MKAREARVCGPFNSCRSSSQHPATLQHPDNLIRRGLPVLEGASFRGLHQQLERMLEHAVP